MEHDEAGNRIYGQFRDLLGQRVVVAKAADKSYAEGCAQVQVGGDIMRAFFYPTRETAPVLIAALTAFMADTDGVPDLPEPDAEG